MYIYISLELVVGVQSRGGWVSRPKVCYNNYRYRNNFPPMLCCCITIPKGKLGSGAPPNKSSKDGPETPYGASNQHLSGRMQRKRETSETFLTLPRIKPNKEGGQRCASQTESGHNGPGLTPCPVYHHEAR
jgi:hypothetical protein